MSRPTEQAIDYFKHAQSWAFNEVMKFDDNAGLAKAITDIAYGLEHLTTGLRATYMKLEELERRLPPRRPGM
jgi:hypothetical protein